MNFVILLQMQILYSDILSNSGVTCTPFVDCTICTTYITLTITVQQNQIINKYEYNIKTNQINKIYIKIGFNANKYSLINYNI